MCDNLIPVKMQNGRTAMRPCGHCLSCLRKYQQQVTDRLSIEFDAWKKCKNGSVPVVFFTLDYRPESVNKLLHFFDEKQNLRTYRYRGIIPQNIVHQFDIIDYNQSIKIPLYKRKEHQKCIEDTFLSLAPLDGFSNRVLDDVPQLSPRDLGCENVYQEDEIKWPILGDSIQSPVLCVNTCSKTDVSEWIKRCRRRFDYHVIRDRCKSLLYISYNSISRRRYSPRLVSSTWKDQNNIVRPLPFAALTPTFKYYITLEYGPQTYRPHAHGVLFGVTEAEFRKYFAPDWRKHFGNVTFESYNPLKGGMLYLGKYCSKGFFENPLCRKNEIWEDSDGNLHQVFNKEYYYNLTHFGINAPLVDKPGHLQSKGLGIRYSFNDEIQTYWGSTLSLDHDYNFPHYITLERFKPVQVSAPFAQFNDSYGCKSQKYVEQNPDSPLTYPYINYPFKVTKYDQQERPIAVSYFDPSVCPDNYLALQQAQKRFTRSYLSFEKDTQKISSKTFESPLHRYYSRYLLPLSLQFARAYAVYLRDYNEYLHRKSLYLPLSSGEARFSRVATYDFNKKTIRLLSEKKQLLSLGRDYNNTTYEIMYENNQYKLHNENQTKTLPCPLP